MAAAMLEDSGTVYCKNCKRDIMQQNYEMHEVHCHRKLKLCEKCEEPIPISEMVEHMNEYHALVECKCKMRVEKSLLQKHEQEECSHRMIQCTFCEMSLKSIDLGDHEKTCGCRTEHCVNCDSYIMIRDASTHDCSQMKAKQKEKNRPIADDFPRQFLDESFDFTSNIPSDSAHNSFGFVSDNGLRENFMNRDYRPGVSNQAMSLPSSNASVQGSRVSSRRTGYRTMAAHFSRPANTNNSRIVISDSESSDNVAGDLKGLNLNSGVSASGGRVKNTNKKQVGTEMGANRNSKGKNSRLSRVKTKPIDKKDDDIGLGIQGRSVQADLKSRDLRLPTRTPLESDVCADGGARTRSDRNAPDESTGWRDVPIDVEGECFRMQDAPVDGDEPSKMDNETGDFGSDNVQLPCEICDALVDSNHLQMHQQQCLREQQQALQTFQNQLTEALPAKEEEIIVDDKPDLVDNNEETSIPCEFCGTAFPIEDFILHQPYCDANPHIQSDQMDIISGINSVPASNSNLPRGFWQSRLDAPPVYIEESSTSFNVYQDGSSHNRVYTDGDNDEMMPDAALSGSDDESLNRRSQQRHWP